MKLASFEFKGNPGWGFVLKNPFDDQLWVYEPEKVNRQLKASATMTSGWAVSMPEFMPECKWPETLVDFLRLEDEGMKKLEYLVKFFTRYLEQCDIARMTVAGHPLSEVQLRCPIPQPRLMWGLVQNCPTFIRFNPQRQSTNLFPQGHQRPCGSVVGHGQIFFTPGNTGGTGFNVELGVVIGKKGKYIPVNKALDYVAGYTVVTDSQVNGYYSLMDTQKLGGRNFATSTDWYVDATGSWAGKMADAHCGVGPWITTGDEIGCPYDLLAYTKQAGMLRDRAHMSTLLVGIERTIQWYSSFATLYPGDIIHMGTVGTDGLGIPPEMEYSGPDCTIESEIEKVGYLKNPVLDTAFPDWRSDDDETKAIAISPAVRDVIKEGKAEIASPDDWKLESTRHFWTMFKNYDAIDKEGLVKLKTPRFLNAPNSALGLDKSEVEIPPRANNLEISIELGAVLKKLSKEVKPEEADDHILGYTPLISITDSSFDDILVEPTTSQEKGIPLVYGRWGDGYNTVSPKLTVASWKDISSRKMTLTVEGIGSATANVSEYYATLIDSLPFMTTYITMFPGDVITFGHTANRIVIPADKVKDGMKITGSIEGMGEISITLKHSSAANTTVAYNQAKL